MVGGVVRCLIVQARALLYEASARFDCTPEEEDIAYWLQGIVGELDDILTRLEKLEKERGGGE